MSVASSLSSKELMKLYTGDPHVSSKNETDIVQQGKNKILIEK